MMSKRRPKLDFLKRELAEGLEEDEYSVKVRQINSLKNQLQFFTLDPEERRQCGRQLQELIPEDEFLRFLRGLF